MRKYMFAGALALAAAPILVGSAFAFVNPFTVEFEFAADGTNWIEARTGQTGIDIGSGETTPQGVAYTPAPDADPNFPNNGWLRFGRTANQAFGVTFLRPSGIQGGDSTVVPQNYEITADVFAVTNSFANRYDIGLFARFPVTETNDPLRIYYANGQNPSVPLQFGIRGAGQGNNQAINNPLITGNTWVRMRMRVDGNQVTYGFDTNRDGVEESTATLTIASSAFQTEGFPGLFVTSNDQTTGAAILNSFGYFDNFTFTPLASNVDGWLMY